MKYFQTFIIIIFFSLNLHSQDFDSLDQKSEFAIGIGTNYSWNSYSLYSHIDMSYANINYGYGIENETGNSISEGIDFLWRINRDSPSWQNSILFSAGYSSSDFISNFESLHASTTDFDKDGNITVKDINSKIDMITESKYEYLYFSSNYRKQILDLDLHISLGISLNFLISSEFSIKMSMKNNSTFSEKNQGYPYKLSDDKKSIIIQEGKDLDAETYVFYLPIGIDYEFSLYDFSIIPQIQYSIPLTKMNVELNMARTSYVFGLKVLYNLD